MKKNKFIMKFMKKIRKNIVKNIIVMFKNMENQ